MSFDVVSLFTSIPLETARAIVLDRLSNDCTLEDHTNLTITELTEALDICLTTTYFTYNNKCYEQSFGTPMGSSLSPVIANMVMEDLEQQALSTFHNPPSVWVRYVDDVYAIVKTENVDEFHKHLNTINSSIQFTLEMETSGSIAFLDVLLTLELDGSLSTSIFRKPTHTGRYLPFNSHHPFSQKVSIARTLYSRAEKLINNESNRKPESSKIKDTLQSNGFPTPIYSNTFFSKTTQNRNSSNNYTTFVSIPYLQGVSEPIKRVLSQVGIKVALKPYFTLSSVFRKPKDVICDKKKCGLVYEIPCRDCDAVYVGETARSLSTRKKEHVKAVKEMNLQKSALCQYIETCDPLHCLGRCIHFEN